MRFIGDAHGYDEDYYKLIASSAEPSIQVGDMGMGFVGKHSTEWLPSWNPKDRFIRGNHDNPAVCRAHPNYLGDFGITDEGIFFISGAYSIDWRYRKEGESWWPDEELSLDDCAKVVDLYEKSRPQFVVSHDSPISKLIPSHHMMDNTRTGRLLDMLFHIHAPEFWIHGHHHTKYERIINGCRIVGLGELGVYDYRI